ncbi:acyl-CoA dehydrogenase [Streptomyces durbertensis]|uniref:Acyl-CoA dehydrogenase n=1 Tax=Streptomyces durbertensis TaxID=2448886 RepID=A0ABR6EA44_9ACTN|nr:acyl-CoA dehydrogenase family protein [Streptomyces durbertensis]MBB1242206.1 acyl-CoA dehydrogenase [Streptomyces durbertensis]
MTAPGVGTGGPAQHRVDALEHAFGPLDAPDNPCGAAALLEADAACATLPAAEHVLDAQDFNAEFVPVELGGRLDRMDVLGRVLRPVFRRDASLGFGYGLNCFFAAAPVWTAGDGRQRRQVARTLLEGRRVAVARHGVAHGNDFVRDEFTVAALPDGRLLLDGEKTGMANAARAASLVIFARDVGAAGGGGDGRGHTVLLVDRDALPADRVVDLGRRTTTGMRSAEFGGLRVTECPVPREAVVGAPGGGYELSLRSSLVIRGLIPSIVLAGADTALRTAAAFADRPRADGRSSLDVQHVRDVLTGAFLDLLLIDCLALVATRALHLLPGQVSAYAATAAYLAPKLAAECMDEMSAVLGEASFAGDGAYGMFEKQLRDLPVTSMGHAGSAGRQVSILPQLPFFARYSWFADAEPPADLFRPDLGLPPLDLSRPSLLGDGDPLAATLLALTDELESAGPPSPAGDTGLLRFLTRAFAGELDSLRKSFRDTPIGDRQALASPHCMALADRYSVVLAAASCLGVWRQQLAAAAAEEAADPFLADPAWVSAALYRLCRRLGLPLPDRPVTAEERVLAEVLRRLRGGRGYDLYGSRLA